MTTTRKLTVRRGSEVQSGSKDVILWDSEVKGFGLKVTPKGKRTFILFYRNANNVQRKPSIGNFPEVKPEQARDRARDMLADIRKGLDPSAIRKTKRAGRGKGTVSSFLAAYLRHKSKEGRKSAGEMELIFKHDILPVFRSKQAEDVTTWDMTNLLDAVEARSSSVAGAVRRQLSAF